MWKFDFAQKNFGMVSNSRHSNMRNNLICDLSILSRSLRHVKSRKKNLHQLDEI